MNAYVNFFEKCLPNWGYQRDCDWTISVGYTIQKRFLKNTNFSTWSELQR